MQQFALRKRWFAATGLVALLLALFWYVPHPTLPARYFGSPPQSDSEASRAILQAAQAIALDPPAAAAFGDRGLVSEKLASWIDETSSLGPRAGLEVHKALEDAVSTLYPFIIHPSHTKDKTPLASLRKRQEPNSRGIVIPVGRDHFRYAVHLIANIREVLGSSLPIEIAYAGDDDLPEDHRLALQSLGDEIFPLDVLSVFSDETLDLRNGGWAVKPFAVLASRFEQTIMLDADTVFMQKPEALLDTHSGYLSTGALLFHDRLLWQNVFKVRAVKSCRLRCRRQCHIVT